MRIIWLVISLIFAYVITNIILDEKAPKETAKATLIKKEQDNHVDANNIINTDYILTFDINGNIKKFSVNYSKYESYIENQQGTLTYKRNKFVDFV